MTNASAGNRTRVTSMATMYSATRPLMLLGSLHATLSSAGELDFPAREMTWLRTVWWFGCTATLGLGIVVRLRDQSGTRSSAARPTWDSWLGCATALGMGMVVRLREQSGSAGWAAEPLWDFFVRAPPATPAIAQLAEHLTVEACRNQMVPGSIPGRRIFLLGPRA